MLPRHVAPVPEANPHFPSVETGVQVPKLDWHRFETAQKAGVFPQFPFTEQQSPKELPRHIAFTVEAEPHFLSVETGVQVPKAGWHRFVVPQKAGVLPQLPLMEQQFPNELPLHVAFTVEADPHFPSGEIVGVGIEELDVELPDVALELELELELDVFIADEEDTVTVITTVLSQSPYKDWLVLC